MHVYLFFNSITGFTAIITTNCTSNEPYFATNLVWNDYVNPCIILFLYIYFAVETREALFQQVNEIHSLYLFIKSTI